MVDSGSIRHIARDFALALCQFQVGWMNSCSTNQDRPSVAALAANWITRHWLATAYLVAMLSWVPLLASLDSSWEQGDIHVYKTDADTLIKGQIPYRDTLVEYPPYAIPIFLLPRVFGSENYLDWFMMMAALCDLSIRAALVLAGVRYAKSLRSLLPLICYCAAVPFLRFFLFQRFDLWPAFICVTALLLFCAEKPGWSGLLIAIGIGVKAYPIVFVPPLLVLALRQRKAGHFSAGLIGGLSPILLLGFEVPWWRFAQFQGDRGLQCESLVASLVWGANHLGLTDATWVPVNRWTEVQGSMASALFPWARALLIVTVLFSIMIASCAAAQCKRPTIGSIARLLLGPLLAFVAFNQVLSPQFMIWLLPLAALGTLEGNLWLVFGIPLATMLTPVIFPSLSGNYSTGLNSLETMILVTRNLMLVVVWWLLVREQWQIWRHGDQAKSQASVCAP
jgi:hypothetical protein